jgi:hypothetical protein
MILVSVIICPHCATAKSEAMPTNACQIFYTCNGCGAALAAEARRLLCVLLLRLGSVPTDSGSAFR